MKGYIHDQSIILTETLPNNLQNGDEVEVTIVEVQKKRHSFPTFNLGIKDQYLHREKIYEQESDLS